jgi:hypothetical protein
MIKDLPELDDGHISEHNQLGNKEYSQVKQQHHPYNGYEMHQQQMQPQQFRPLYEHQQPHEHPHQHPHHGHQPHQVHQHIPAQQHQEPIEEPEPQPPSYTPTQMMAPEEISCRLICSHIENCPICAKFYSRDNSQLIILIIAQLIFIVYLLRKLIP